MMSAFQDLYKNDSALVENAGPSITTNVPPSWTFVVVADADVCTSHQNRQKKHLLKNELRMEHYHYIVNGFLHEDKDGRLLDVATMDVFAKTESEALDKAAFHGLEPSFNKLIG